MEMQRPRHPNISPADSTGMLFHFELDMPYRDRQDTVGIQSSKRLIVPDAGNGFREFGFKSEPGLPRNADHYRSPTRKGALG